MIISHKYKFIFFAVPKTATHAIRFALRPHLGPEDEEHVFKFKPSKLNIPEFKDRKNGHFTVEEIKPFLSDEIWETYFKFSFVRNPYDRFISLCFYHYKALNNSPDHLDQMLFNIANLPLETRPRQFRSQSKYLFDSEGSTPLDIIGRFESIQEDFDRICERLEIPQSDLQRVNTSSHNKYLSYYESNEFKDLIETRYQDDLNNFNYSFDNYSGNLPTEKSQAV